ncbi:AAA family ATPase [Faecalicoccus pleomorphus]|uniref:AAA family ATPase n=1 Tax=Faecalicoccus pleomorphus TaxID=1323 RepID=UPI0019606BF8|nr:ATP-binding protein [Faecalicoccus pleomorphus]MBM6765895.1 AAA family ATPase [Faecalicoccus pleomorphus]
MYKFNINSLELKNMDDSIKIIPKRINVIVGPNNSGKSRLLKELRDKLAGMSGSNRIISNIDISYPESSDRFYDSYQVEQKICRRSNGEWYLNVFNSKSNQTSLFLRDINEYTTRNRIFFTGDDRQQVASWINNRDWSSFLQVFSPLFYQFLGTEEKLLLCNTQSNYGLDSNSINYLSIFKYNDRVLSLLADKVKAFFNRDIFLDYLSQGDQICFRVGDNFDYITQIEVDRLNQIMVNRLSRENRLEEQGDGLRSFVSTFLSLYTETSDMLLIDEPENFLHPPLQRRIGEEIALASNSKEKTVFLATHSVEVLKGILSKSNDVNVIRITQPKPGENSITLLKNEDLEKVIKDPLLRVSRVLEGIFCDRVIVTEGEADELIYQELIEKMFPESGLSFAHAQNKQTIPKIIEFYHTIGVKYEAIVDFDVIRELRGLRKLLINTEMIENEVESLLSRLNLIKQNLLIEDEIKAYHQRGISSFKEEDQKKIRDIFKECSKNHIHILETGELETILENFDVHYKEKKKWIIDALEKVADDSFTFSSQDDLYKFIEKIVDREL